jgi:hypothetical protein
MPMGLPSGPNTATIPTGLPGTTETTFTPEFGPARPGMNKELPSSDRVGTSRSSPNATSMAAMASAIESAARVAAASR